MEKYEVFFSQRGELKEGTVFLRFDPLLLTKLRDQLTDKVREIYGGDAILIAYEVSDGSEEAVE
jgi:hypothetical protein